MYQYVNLFNSSMAAKLPLSSFTAIPLSKYITEHTDPFCVLTTCVYTAVYLDEYTFRMNPQRQIAGKEHLVHY